MIQFHVLSLQSDGFLSLNEKETIFEADPLLQELDAVDTDAKKLSRKVEEAIELLFYLTLENLSDVISNNPLYSF